MPAKRVTELRKKMVEHGLVGPKAPHEEVVEIARDELAGKLPPHWQKDILDAPDHKVVEIAHHYFDTLKQAKEHDEKIKDDLKRIAPKIAWGVRIGKLRALRKTLEEELAKREQVVVNVPGEEEREGGGEVPTQEEIEQMLRRQFGGGPMEAPPPRPREMPPEEFMREQDAVMHLQMRLARHEDYEDHTQTVNVPPNPEVEELLKKRSRNESSMQKTMLEQIEQLIEMGSDSNKKRKEDFEKELEGAVSSAGESELMAAVADKTEEIVKKNMETTKSYPFPKIEELDIDPELEEKYPFLNKFILAGLTKSGMTPELEDALEHMKKSLIPEETQPHELAKKAVEAVDSGAQFFIEEESRKDPEDAAVESLLAGKALEAKNTKALPVWAEFERKARKILWGEEENA
jgi:hypothetical protein